MEINKIYLGDCLDILKTLPDNSIDSIVCDPPYGLGKEPNPTELLLSWIETGDYKVKGKGFMNKEWDSFVPSPIIWKECFRVLKHGGYLLAFFGTRTYDYGTMAIRLAGFQIRDSLEWIYASGFPKGLNIGEAIDKIQGIEYPKNELISNNTFMTGGNYTRNTIDIQSDIAKQYQGWNTALKPAHEPICMAQKPIIEKTIAENVLKYNTGGLNIDGCRIGTDIIGGGTTPNLDDVSAKNKEISGEYKMSFGQVSNAERIDYPEHIGRYPANLIHDGSEEVLSIFPNTNPSKRIKDGANRKSYQNKEIINPSGWKEVNRVKKDEGYDDNGGSAARYFYCAKASKSERDEGFEEFEERMMDTDGQGRNQAGCNSKDRKPMLPRKNFHPTCKPIRLMRYLCRLVTPKNGVVLDPFLGSGTTVVAAIQEGFNYIGIEKEPEYFEIAEARIEYAKNNNEKIEIPFDK